MLTGLGRKNWRGG